MRKTVLKTIGAALMFCLTVGGSSEMQAQQMPVIPEYNSGTGTAPGADNTGAAIARIMGGVGGTLLVEVWDGTTPQFHWRDTGTGVTGTLPLSMPNGHDPDVAISRDGMCMVIVYESNADIYAEGYQYDPATSMMNPTSGPVLVSTGGGSARTANIDAGPDNLGVVVWQEGSKVVTRGIEMCSVGLMPMVALNGVVGGINAHMPDVSVYFASNGFFFNYTYVNFPSSSDEEVIFQVEKASQILSGSLGTVHVASVESVTGNDSFLFPRIDSRFKYGNIVDASAIVYTKTIGSNKRHIMSYTNAAGLNDLTSPSNIYYCFNTNPAITFVEGGPNGPMYIAGWYHNGGCGAGTLNRLLSVRLDGIGNPLTTNLLNYRYVNQTSTGNERALSLASDQYTNNRMLAAYTSDTNFGRNMFKETGGNSPNYTREAALETATDVYPNPATEMVNVKATNLRSIAVYSLTGQLVKSWSNVEGSSTHTLELNDVPSGVYIMEIHSDKGIEKNKLTIQ